ncbi:hypothetical protein N7485_009872 [Penicillium canescens]|nr:hypothetical protein N7485_009872 [Penicillium canescens]
MSEKGDKLLDDHPQLAEFLACSFMLISFEVFRGAEHDWLLHLDATASLMGLLSPEAIFNPDSVICDTSSTPFAEQHRSPRSGMVEGLQFLTVAVIWFDIFACVTTGRAPRLPYQQWLRIQGLNTADLMGCENWVMLIIGDLAHFSIWKETQEEQGKTWCGIFYKLGLAPLCLCCPSSTTYYCIRATAGIARDTKRRFPGNYHSSE